MRMIILFSLILLSGFVDSVCDLMMKLPLIIQFGIMILMMIGMMKLMLMMMKEAR